MIAQRATTTCENCAVVLPATSGPVHRYMRQSPECWAAFNRVLAREFGDPALFQAIHRLTVDSYAGQHPRGQPARSVTVHLVGLHLAVDRTLDQTRVMKATARLMRSVSEWPYLVVPQEPGDTTVADVDRTATPEQHVDMVGRWARSVWDAWSAHHELIRELSNRYFPPGRA